MFPRFTVVFHHHKKKIASLCDTPCNIHKNSYLLFHLGAVCNLDVGRPHRLIGGGGGGGRLPFNFRLVQFLVKCCI